MSTATMTRLPLRSLPAPSKGALVAEHHDPRPCVTNPPQWWDTGDAGNAKAVELCQTRCPIYGTGKCKPLPGETGMIRDGVAHDDRGKPADIKNLPHHHHDLIVQMRKDRKTFVQIGATVGLSADSIRCYCRSRGIPTSDTGGTISDYHDVIVTMRAAGVSWQAVADHIGHDRSAVKSYWFRSERRFDQIDTPAAVAA